MARTSERGSGAGATLLHGRPNQTDTAWLYVKSGGDSVVASAHLGRGRKRRTKHGMHGRRGSPLPYQATRDPWGHKDMIRSTKSGASRSQGAK